MKILTVLVVLLKTSWCFTSAKVESIDLKDGYMKEFADVLLDFHFGAGSLFNQITQNPNEHRRNKSSNHMKEIIDDLQNGRRFKEVVINNEEALNAFSMIAPFHKVGGACFQKSVEFIQSLFNPNKTEFQAALLMLDATSKLPNGIYRDSIEYCYYIKNILGLKKCPIEVGKLHIPYGNTKAIGNNVQCHKLDDIIPARYCRIGLTRHEGKKFVKPNFGGILSAMNWEWSICIPEACTTSDVQNNYEFLFQLIKEVKVEVLNCEEPIETAPAALPLTIIWIGLAIFIFLGTLLDLLEINETRILYPLKTLSMYRSLKSTVKSVIRPNTSEKVSSIGGILTISLTWVILSNTLRQFMSGNVINQMEPLNIMLKKTSSPPLYNILLNDTLPFDSLFVAFGVAIGYSILKQLETSTFSIKNYLIGNYLKFTLPLIFTFMLMVAYVPFATEGPSYIPVKGRGFVDQIFHMSNFHFLFDDNKNDDMNYTWFISCLMQLTLLTPLIVYPIKKSPRIGIAFCILLLIISFLLFEAIIFFYNLPPSLLSSSFETQSKFKDLLPINFYQLPIARIQPFLSGIVVGYIVFEHDKSKVLLSKVFNIGMWLIAFIIIGFSLGSSTLFTNDTIYGKPIWNVEESIVYTLTIKLLWSFAIGWIICSCHLGYGGIFNKFLSWGPFLVISRTFISAYLIHDIVIKVILRTTHSSYEYNGMVMAQYSNAVVTISLAFSILMHAFCVESFLHERKSGTCHNKEEEEELQEKHDE